MHQGDRLEQHGVWNRGEEGGVPGKGIGGAMNKITKVTTKSAIHVRRARSDQKAKKKHSSFTLFVLLYIQSHEQHEAFPNAPAAINCIKG